LFWNPSFLETALDRASRATSGSFFNSWLDQRHFNKNELPKGSAIELFYNKYMIGENEKF
jgi:hypothetical protein